MEESASAEVDRRNAQRERRCNLAWAQIAARGIEMQRTAGRGRATAFMMANGLSEHVVLRVLSGAAFRRKGQDRR